MAERGSSIVAEYAAASLPGRAEREPMSDQEQHHVFVLANGHKISVEVTVDGPLAATGYRLRVCSLSHGLIVLPRAGNTIDVTTTDALAAEAQAMKARYPDEAT
jgi:hypothetical protein